jgi:hypothetical protein
MVEANYGNAKAKAAKKGQKGQRREPFSKTVLKARLKAA